MHMAMQCGGCQCGPDGTSSTVALSLSGSLERQQHAYYCSFNKNYMIRVRISELV